MLFWLSLPETSSPRLRCGLNCLLLGCSPHLKSPQCLATPGRWWREHPGGQWLYFYNDRPTQKKYTPTSIMTDPHRGSISVDVLLCSWDLVPQNSKPLPLYEGPTPCIITFICHPEPSVSGQVAPSLALSGSHPVLHFFGHTGVMY